MLRWIKAGCVLTCLGICVGFLHYTLPQRDVVRVTSTEVLRKDFSGLTRIFYAQPDSGDAAADSRDVRLIYAITPNGRPSIYRNEDTGFGWPPYFKLDSSNLQGQAADAISTKDAPQWYVIRHYGWRSPFLSIYPNAVSIWPVEGPDVRLIPWFNITFLLVLFAVARAIYVRVKRLWDRRVEPRLEQMEAGFDETRDRIGRWFRG